jgi:hypothetical protein
MFPTESTPTFPNAVGGFDVDPAAGGRGFANVVPIATSVHNVACVEVPAIRTRNEAWVTSVPFVKTNWP